MARRLKTIAKYINANHAKKISAHVERSHCCTDRKIGRLRWPGKGRDGTRIIVTDRSNGKVLLDHNAAETYRCNDEVERWLTGWERDQKC